MQAGTCSHNRAAVATAGRPDPFAVFEEWASEADDEAYESL